MSAPTRRINITIGTAGHVDHGKTAMVRLLTGCETDTLKAEKERGLSIELGFAPCSVGGFGVGIVDVPGHEHFVKTMVAGAAGMDAVMLVVAADDGVMQQTREHLDILTLLGVADGIVVLTKIDRVAPEKVEERTDELREFLCGTFLENAEILPLSNITGEGFDGFHKALGALVERVGPKSAEGVFRMPVDRAFSPKGVGTVLTGIGLSGRVAVGDEVVLLPQAETGRINAIEVYGEASDIAMAGECAALNVRRWDHGAIERGNTVATPGVFEPRRWFACRLRLLDYARIVIKNGTQVRFHTGTSETTASVYLMEGQRARAGEERIVQVYTEAPIVAGPGESFIIRCLSPMTTVGGGMIIEGLDRRLRRSREGTLEDLRERAEAASDVTTFAEYCLKAAGLEGTAPAALARRVKTPQPRMDAILAGLSDAGRVVALAAGLYMHADGADEAAARIRAALAAHHEGASESPGLSMEALAEASGLSAPVVAGSLSRLVERGEVKQSGGRFALSTHEVTVSGEDREVFERVETLLREGGFHPPSIDEVIAGTGFEAARVKKAVGSFIERGILVRVAEGLFFHREALAEAQGRLVDHIRREGKLESVKFKYLLDTTRKYAIPLLDYFDNANVTVRVGYTRYLKGE